MCERVGVSVLPPSIVGVALGGAVGALLRHWAGHWAATAMPEHSHRATVLVNVIGSLVLGALAAWAMHRPDAVPEWVRHCVMVGAIGAITTFSTFSVDALKLAHSGKWLGAAGYVLVSVAVCLLAAGLAWWAVSRLLPPAETGSVV